MVNISPLKISFMLALFMLCTINVTASTTQSKLILFIDKHESVLGRPIRAELYGVSLKTEISNIDLSELNIDFGVVTDYIIKNTTDKRWPKQTIQVLKLKLYPRHTGNITIPQLIAKDVHSKKKTVLVTEKGTGIPKITISTKTPYERQQIIVNISISSNNSTSRLSIKKEFNINGFESTILPFVRKKNIDGTYTLNIGWALTPLKHGKQELELPPIKYSVSGVYRKLFYLPHTLINVKALPSYLPPTTPVGKISIQSHLPSSWLLKTNTLSYWEVKLSGNVSNAYRLPAILRQIRSNKHIKFLPVNSIRSKEITNNNLTSITNHSIPFKVLKSGFINLPELKLQYFNPENGKINTIIYKKDNVFSLNLFWRTLLIVSLISLLYYLLSLAYKWRNKFKYSQLKRKQAIQILRNKNTGKDIRTSLRLLAESEFWPSNTTLNQWSRYWKGKYITNSSFDDFIYSLSSSLYSSDTNHSLNKLSSQLLELVENKKRR